MTKISFVKSCIAAERRFGVKSCRRVVQRSCPFVEVGSFRCCLLKQRNSTSAQLCFCACRCIRVADLLTVCYRRRLRSPCRAHRSAVTAFFFLIEPSTSRAVSHVFLSAQITECLVDSAHRAEHTCAHLASIGSAEPRTSIVPRKLQVARALSSLGSYSAPSIDHHFSDSAEDDCS